MKNTRNSRKTKKLAGAIVLPLVFFFSTGLAQRAIPAAGGQGQGSGGSISYSVGQLVGQTHFGTGGSVAEGVQQPYEISVVTSMDELTEIHLSITAYPIPTRDFLTLEVKDYEPLPTYYQLYDMTGQLWLREKVLSSHTTIDMGLLVPGIYFIKVIQGNSELITFKVLKTH